MSTTPGRYVSGHLRRLASEQRRANLATRAYQALDRGAHHCGIEARLRDIIEEGDGSRAVDQQIVGAVIDEVRRRVGDAAGLEGEVQLVPTPSIVAASNGDPAGQSMTPAKPPGSGRTAGLHVSLTRAPIASFTASLRAMSTPASR